MREEWKRWRRHTDTTDYWIVRLKRTMTTELLYALLRIQGVNVLEAGISHDRASTRNSRVARMRNPMA